MNHSIYHIEALILETGEGGEYNYKTDVLNDGSEIESRSATGLSCSDVFSSTAF